MDGGSTGLEEALGGVGDRWTVVGEPPLLQFHAAIGRGDDLGVVRGDDHGGPAVAALPKQVSKCGAAGRIEPGSRRSTKLAITPPSKASPHAPKSTPT